MKKGTVLYWKNFKFHDNNTADKFLIVLNSPVNLKTPFLCCKTTSKMKHTDGQGCYPQYGVYVLLANEDLFPKKTWVQLHEFYEIDSKELLEAGLKDNNLKIAGDLKSQIANAIVNCAKRSDDISDYQISLLR